MEAAAVVVVVLTVWGAVCLYIGWRVGAADLEWWKQRADELQRYIRQLGGSRRD